MSDPASDPISDLFGELNSVLDDYGFEGQIEGIAQVDVVVRYGPITHETFLRVRIGEEGWTLVDKAEQMQRLRREILDQHYDSDE